MQYIKLAKESDHRFWMTGGRADDWAALRQDIENTDGPRSVWS